jgi:hypothetical protein
MTASIPPEPDACPRAWARALLVASLVLLALAISLNAWIWRLPKADPSRLPGHEARSVTTGASLPGSP